MENPTKLLKTETEPFRENLGEPSRTNRSVKQC